MLPYLVFAFVSVLVYFLLIKIIVDPPPASIAATLLIIPAFAIFLVPAVYGVKKAQQIQILCPACHKDLNRKVQRVLRTRCCPECGVQIVEGSVGTDEVREPHRELIQRSQLQFMRYWVWAWPLMSLFIIVAEWWFPGSQRESEAFLWMPGVLGAVSSGWMLMRGKDRSALLPLVVSLVLMGIGGWMFLQ